MNEFTCNTCHHAWLQECDAPTICPYCEHHLKILDYRKTYTVKSFDDGRQEGYDQGYHEGYENGYDACYFKTNKSGDK